MERVRTALVRHVTRRTVCILLCAVGTTLLLVAAPVHGQDPPAPTRANAVYFELLGNGGLFSVNYERALTPALRVRTGNPSIAYPDEGFMPSVGVSFGARF